MMRKNHKLFREFCGFEGKREQISNESAGIRTQDLRLKRPLLYLLSYTPCQFAVTIDLLLPAVNSFRSKNRDNRVDRTLLGTILPDESLSFNSLDCARDRFAQACSEDIRLSSVEALVESDGEQGRTTYPHHVDTMFTRLWRVPFPIPGNFRIFLDRV